MIIKQMPLAVTLLLINIFLRYVYGEGCAEIVACQDIFILLRSENNSAKVIDIEQGAIVKLFCRFCSSEESYKPKDWYYKKREPHYLMEKLIGRHLDDKNMSISSDYVLRIKHFNTRAHSGIYACKDPETNLYSKTIFSYVLEGVYATNITPYTGQFEEWFRYKEGIIDPINKQFEKPNYEPFVTFEMSYSFSFRIKTYWEPWSKCENFNGQENQRTKRGICHLKIVPNKSNKLENISAREINYINQFYATQNDVPCRSITLNDKLPEISKLVRFVPDYKAKELCILQNRIPVPSWDSEYKFSTILHIPEGGHRILTCPESVLKTKVDWLKDGKLLNSSIRNNIAKNEVEPPLTIDSFNSVFILHATKKEEGNYSCIVDGRKIFKYHVKVFTKSGLLNDDFFRYSIYLGFVLLLTTTCYCAGIFVAWHERASFSDPLNLNNKKTQYQHLQSVDSEQ